jgi:hypothetical protein
MQVPYAGTPAELSAAADRVGDDPVRIVEQLKEWTA